MQSVAQKQEVESRVLCHYVSGFSPGKLQPATDTNSLAAVDGIYLLFSNCLEQPYAELMKDPSTSTEEIQLTQIIIVQLENEELPRVLTLPP